MYAPRWNPGGRIGFNCSRSWEHLYESGARTENALFST